MKKTILIAATILIASTGCKSEIDGKTAATVTEPTTQAAGETAKQEEPAAAAKTTEVALDATKTKVEWVGAKVTGDHKGGFKGVTGTATFNEAGDLTAVAADIDTTTVYSDTEKLTGHLKSPDFFDVEKFPKSTFVTKSIEKQADGSLLVTGDLDLHGVKKQIAFPATTSTEGNLYIANAEFTLMRFDFGIEYKGKPDDLIKKEVLMKLTIAAPKPGES